MDCGPDGAVCSALHACPHAAPYCTQRPRGLLSATIFDHMLGAGFAHFLLLLKLCA